MDNDRNKGRHMAEAASVAGSGWGGGVVGCSANLPPNRVGYRDGWGGWVIRSHEWPAQHQGHRSVSCWPRMAPTEAAAVLGDGQDGERLAPMAAKAVAACVCWFSVPMCSFIFRTNELDEPSGLA